jgi:hypothetical protein
VLCPERFLTGLPFPAMAGLAGSDRKVVFPAPFGPAKAATRPSGSASVQSRNAHVRP